MDSSMGGSEMNPSSVVQPMMNFATFMAKLQQNSSPPSNHGQQSQQQQRGKLYHPPQMDEQNLVFWQVFNSLQKSFSANVIQPVLRNETGLEQIPGFHDIGENFVNIMNSIDQKTRIECTNSVNRTKTNEEKDSKNPHDSNIQDESKEQIDLTTVDLYGQGLVCVQLDGQRRLCLAQISATLLKDFSYNEIHNRRVALGITCVQCTPAQLELLRRAGAMPVSSRRCGTITIREAERLVKSFLEEIIPPKLPDNFSFPVLHKCGWGAQGNFVPQRYNSSRAKCIRCTFCEAYFSPNKFIFHCHRPDETGLNQLPSDYRHPDAANFNAWRRHLYLADESPSHDLIYAWEDVKAMFNGGNRKRSAITRSPLASDSPQSSYLDHHNNTGIDFDICQDKRSKIIHAIETLMD